MGNLTNDMTRLRGEVDALRNVRGALMRELQRGARNLTTTVSAMQAGFTAAHNAMARKTGQNREAFVSGVIHEVTSLLGDFSRLRNDMARKESGDRAAFLTDLRNQVADLRSETADDLAGARLAWRGRGFKKNPEGGKKTPPPGKVLTAASSKIKAAEHVKDPMKLHQANGKSLSAQKHAKTATKKK